MNTAIDAPSKKDTYILIQVIVTLWVREPNIWGLQENPAIEVLLETSQPLLQYAGHSDLDSATGQPICNPCSNLFKIDFCMPCYLCSQGMEILNYASDTLIIGIYILFCSNT